MEREALRALLENVADGRLSVRDAEARLHAYPYEDLGFAKLDHQRALRDHLPEVVLGTGKTPAECRTIAERIAADHERLLMTRIDEAQAAAVQAVLPASTYHERARCLSWRERPSLGQPGVLVCSAGTADLPVAEEAVITADMMDCLPARLFDVGVAGLHRLLDNADELRRAKAIVVVAGMDGALPSVVAGLTAVPVIAVPTSIGYGAAFDGLAALLGMLNSCAAGVSVVNIDNGFGAGYLAATIVRGESSSASSSPPAAPATANDGARGSASASP